MRLSGSVLVSCLAVLILGPALALAGGIYTPMLGSRATSMGGAFIGLADDYSAVHWNPAGIVQIAGTEATVSAQDVILLGSCRGTVVFDGTGDDDGRYAIQEVRATSVVRNHFAPGVYVYADGGPLGGIFDKVGLCAYTLAEYGAAWDGDDVAGGFLSHAWNYDNIFRQGDAPDYESHIRGYVISPVVAKRITNALSIGVSGHALYGHFELTDGGWVQESVFVDNPSPTPDEWNLYLYPYEMTDDLTGWAYGATVGALYDVNKSVSVGVSVRTPMRVKLEGTVKVTSTWEEYARTEQSEDFEFTFPLWAGAGLAYRDFLFDGMTLTADAQWTQWSDVYKIVRNVESELPNDLGTTVLKWENVLDIAVGLDYRLSRSVSVRFGYRSMPSPVPSETFDFVLPMSSKNVFCAGVGYRQDVWKLDLSVAYESGGSRVLSGTTDMDGTHLDDVLIPSLAFVYGF